MQTPASEATDSEDNMLLRFAQGSQVHKIYYLRPVLHSVPESEAQCRFTFSEELLQVVRHAKGTNFEHLLTGDELCFYSEYRHDSVWAPLRANPTRKAQKIHTQKSLVSMI
jgi:hypothetical protein